MMSEENQQQPELEATAAPQAKPRNAMRQWIRDLLVSVVVSVVIITCLYQPVRVEGTSMQPELRNRDRLFINKFVYHFEGISRGDVVVFHYPLNPRESFIKRVIGLPGDHIRIDEGTVYINGKALKEPYVPARYRDHRSMAAGVVPPHEYFVMGDHRNISEDSRDFGPVPRSDIYGKASFVYWPASQMQVIH
jgi:signal peptidase I